MKLKHCLFCKNSIVRGKYCSNKCQKNQEWEAKKQTLISTGKDTTINCKIAKRYLIETNGHICEVCKLSVWNEQLIPLTLDHINGDPYDSRLINLRVICANCDRQSSTFGSKNRGNGRYARRVRYSNKQSY